MSKWHPCPSNAFYLDCIAQKHTPLVHSAGFDLFYIHCPQCQRYYRFHVAKLDFMTDAEWEAHKTVLSP